MNCQRMSEVGICHNHQLQTFSYFKLTKLQFLGTSFIFHLKSILIYSMFIFAYHARHEKMSIVKKKILFV